MSISPWHRSIVTAQVYWWLLGSARGQVESEFCEAARQGAFGSSSSCSSLEGTASRGLLQMKSETKSLSAGPCSPGEAREYTQLHNAYRCLHGSPPLEWSDALAEDAYNQVRNVTSAYDHSPILHDWSEPVEGDECETENLYARYEVSAIKGVTIPHVVLLWYQEVNNCVGGPERFTDGCRPDRSRHGVTLHFTSMIWANAKRLGCAWSDAGSIAICRYHIRHQSNSSNVTFHPNYTENVHRRWRTAADCNATGLVIPRVDQTGSVCRCVDFNGHHDGVWQPTPCNCEAKLLESRSCMCDGASPCNCGREGSHGLAAATGDS
jgi:hypothetical protein